MNSLMKPFVTSPAHNSERGSITVFFLLFAIVMAGAISYSLYFAHAANEKIRIENAVDAETQAMAAHASKGLNMMSANNLAIGASMHIAGAMPILSRYAAVARAVLSSCADIGMNGTVLAGADGDYQRFFNWFMPISKIYLKTAAGVTTLNQKTGKFWLAPAIIHGIESLRLNAPGAVSLPMQLSTVANLQSNVAAVLIFKYQGLRQTSANKAMCHTISSSDGTGGRDNPLHWFAGPFSSFGERGNFAAAENFISQGGNGRGNALDAMAEAAKAEEKVCDPFSGQFNRELCQQIQQMKQVQGNLSMIDEGSMFGFGSCGIGAGGNYAKQIENHFSSQEDSIGFVYPDPGHNGQYEAFRKSINFAALAGLSFRVNKEGDQSCPSEWMQQINGEDICQPSALWHVKEQPSQIDDDDYNLALGGMVQMLKDPSSLKSGWSRTKWAVSQSKSYYYPSSNAAAQDPSSTTPNLSLFWPAWQSKLTPPTVIKELTDLIF